MELVVVVVAAAWVAVTAWQADRDRRTLLGLLREERERVAELGQMIDQYRSLRLGVGVPGPAVSEEQPLPAEVARVVDGYEGAEAQQEMAAYARALLATGRDPAQVAAMLLQE